MVRKATLVTRQDKIPLRALRRLPGGVTAPVTSVVQETTAILDPLLRSASW